MAEHLRTGERALVADRPLALMRRTYLGQVLRKMLREADLRQRATEESALPGAGPPNP